MKSNQYAYYYIAINTKFFEIALFIKSLIKKYFKKEYYINLLVECVLQIKTTKNNYEAVLNN